MRRLFFVLLLLALPLPALAATPRFSIGAGEAVFWNGPFVENQNGKSWTYQLQVTQPGYRLRIGVDHPEAGDNFTVRIESPEGDVSNLSSGNGLYSAEFLKGEPAQGRWVIRVTAARVTDSAFRVRAKLEARPPSLGTSKGPVLPNLQVLPPHEASFLMPVTNGTTADNSVGIDLLGRESCHPEEHAEEQAIRCLRFGFGIRNTGRGPLDLFDTGPAYQDRDLIQRIQLAEGGYVERDAGMARFHKTHGHYHHQDAVALRLFKVTDPRRGGLEPTGDKHFKGFAHRDELLRAWDRFYPTWSKSGFGLLAGWADIYEWDRPGNYIDFGLNTDGRYVVRMWADPVAGVRESNERDNVGYTYLEVTGGAVKLLESGRGTDPWDPCKILMGFGGHPDPKTGPRPSSCPDDTI
jgi:hypothetical protein